MLGIGAGTDAGVGGGLDIAGILGSVAGGGVGVLMAIIGAIKGVMGKSQLLLPNFRLKKRPLKPLFL